MAGTAGVRDLDASADGEAGRSVRSALGRIRIAQAGDLAVCVAPTVTLAIGNNPAGGTLSGPLTAAVNTGTGVATFSGLSIDKAGTGYTLTATGDALTGATSAPFDIAVDPATDRFFGGPYDGWDRAKAAGYRLLSEMTIMMFR